MKLFVKATIIAFLIFTPCSLYASTKTLSAGLKTGYEFSERHYTHRTPTAPFDDGDTSRITISPFIEIVNETEKNSLSLRYDPHFWYDVSDYEDNIDHKLLLDFKHQLTKRWRVNFSDVFVNSDKSHSYSSTQEDDAADTGEGEGEGEEETVAADVLYDEQGRRRYFTNTLSFSTSYLYGKGSQFSYGYTWSLLENENISGQSDYENYDKHSFRLNLSHRFSPYWHVVAGGSYTRGLFEEAGDTVGDPVGDDLNVSENLNQYGTNWGVYYTLNKQQKLSGLYSYSQVDYDDGVLDDSQIHNWTLGYAWQVTPKLALDFGAGPTFTKKDGSPGVWDYNGNAGINYELERGKVSFTGSGGTSFENFSGTSERGTVEFWEARFDYSYKLFERTTLSGYSYYRYQESEEIADTAMNRFILDVLQAGGPQLGPLTFTIINSKRWAAGAKIEHQLWENYLGSLSYGYVRLDSDESADRYREHKVVFSLSYSNELLKW